MTGEPDPLPRALSAFRARFGREPIWSARAPGRVNLIGEHTDYNDGFVLPMAIDLACAAVGGPGEDPAVSRVYSADLDAEARADLRVPLVPDGGPLRYALGVLAQFQRRAGGPMPGLDIAMASSVPLGGGLSSSAAVEVATATLLEAALGTTLQPLEKARLCQRAEHEFAGVPCGIMDQLASVMGREGHALLIDCRSCAVAHVALPAGAEVLVVNTNVRHDLAAGEYAQRRRTCERAAAKLGVASLRDADLSILDQNAGLTEEERRCARHVVAENARVLAAAAAMRSGDLARCGELMHESHISLRDDYRVSCAELDTVVRAMMASGGVYGARMTGGGFGGCAVGLVRAGSGSDFARAVSARYHAAHARACEAFVVRSSEGCAGGHGPRRSA